MNEELLLQLKDAHVHFGGVKALNGASVNIDEGEIVALMGPNGAGKSTVLKSIFGLVKLDSGGVYWHEHKVNPVAHELVQLGISFVPQGRRVFKFLTVKENLEIGGSMVHNKNELARRLEEVLNTFPTLKHKLFSKSGGLSGGQQQLLAIARGLMSDPKVLLLDEPTLGLSPKIVKEIFEHIVDIRDKHKTAIFLVEHNLKSVVEIVDRAYVLASGAVVAQGQGKDIINSDVFEKVFLGKAV